VAGESLHRFSERGRPLAIDQARPERQHHRGLASSWTPAMVRRWHADPFGFLRPWNEVPALIGSAPPAIPRSTGTGVVTFLMG
jgi:hypothetical protein